MAGESASKGQKVSNWVCQWDSSMPEGTFHMYFGPASASLPLGPQRIRCARSQERLVLLRQNI